MKHFKISFTLVALFALSMAFISCGNKSNSAAASSKGNEYTAAYVCPMHCEGSGSNQMGKCPVCGMDYVMNNTHACPMHPEIMGIQGDKCSKCGMDLTAKAKSEGHEGHNH